MGDARDGTILWSSLGDVCEHGQLARSCEICGLRAEVESLRAELDLTRHDMVTESKAAFRAESDLAAVRTDLSVARGALEEIASIRINTKPTFLARRALGLADDWDAGLIATPPIAQLPQHQSGGSHGP